MSLEYLEDILDNMEPRFKEATAEKAAADPEEFVELVRQLTKVQSEILSATAANPTTEEKRLEFDRLREIVIEADQILDSRENKQYVNVETARRTGTRK